MATLLRQGITVVGSGRWFYLKIPFRKSWRICLSVDLGREGDLDLGKMKGGNEI